MKIIPILFSGEMVNALLQNRKTITRRIIKPQPNDAGVSYMKNPPLNWEDFYREEWKPWKWDTEGGETIAKNCPYGDPGDILWVREGFIYNYFEDGSPAYKADWNPTAAEYIKKPVFKPGIHMPYHCCRLFLKVVSVRVERLKDISEMDSIREGVMKDENSNKFINYIDQKYKTTPYIYNLRSAKHSFLTLFDCINDLSKWGDNPWLWVIEFERTIKPDQHEK